MCLQLCVCAVRSVWMRVYALSCRIARVCLIFTGGHPTEWCVFVCAPHICCVSRRLCVSRLTVSEHVIPGSVFAVCGCVSLPVCDHVTTHICPDGGCSLALEAPLSEGRLVPPQWPISSAVGWGGWSPSWGHTSTCVDAPPGRLSLVL